MQRTFKTITKLITSVTLGARILEVLIGKIGNCKSKENNRWLGTMEAALQRRMPFRTMLDQIGGSGAQLKIQNLMQINRVMLSSILLWLPPTHQRSLEDDFMTSNKLMLTSREIPQQAAS